MGNDNSRLQVFGGSLSDLYDEDPQTQPIPFIINVCLKYLAHVKLREPLEMTGLQKALVSVGFSNDDDNPDGVGGGGSGSGAGAAHTPRRPSRTNSAASPALQALHRKTSKTMSLVRPHKKLRTLVRLTKKALNQRRVWPLLELLHPGPLEYTQVVPPSKLAELKAKESVPPVEESCHLVMLVLCDFLKELAEPLWNEEFTRQFQECIYDGNVARMFQLYSVQRTAHKVMSDALMSSLHEFWMQNEKHVTADILSDIFGPSSAQTKLISDPKGPVVYLNAEAGERAQMVFQYILERAVAFVNDARPVESQPGLQTIVVPDQEALRQLEEARRAQEQAEREAKAREEHLKRQVSGAAERAAAMKQRYRDKVVRMWMSARAYRAAPDLRTHFQAWAALARQTYRVNSHGMLEEFREECAAALEARDTMRAELQAALREREALRAEREAFQQEREALQEELAVQRAEVEEQTRRERRWLAEKEELEALFLQQRSAIKQQPQGRPGGGGSGGRAGAFAVGTPPQEQQHRARTPGGRSYSQDVGELGGEAGDEFGGPSGAGNGLGASGGSRHSRRHGGTGGGGLSSSYSAYGAYSGTPGYQGRRRVAEEELTDAELIARLKLHDREIYRHVHTKYFGGAASDAAPPRGVAFGADLRRPGVPPAQNTYYWPAGHNHV